MRDGDAGDTERTASYDARSMDDAELVRGARSGDRSAFAEIYDRYADRIHDFCHSMLRDRAEAADAMQDTFLVAFERLDQLRDPSRLKSWLFAIARNNALQRAKNAHGSRRTTT